MGMLQRHIEGVDSAAAQWMDGKRGDEGAEHPWVEAHEKVGEDPKGEEEKPRDGLQRWQGSWRSETW